MKTVPLYGKKDGKYKAVVGYTVVDDDMFDLVSKHHWNRTRQGYASTNVKTKDGYKVLTMHRVILGVNNPTILVDHKDLNKLNNCKENLRTCTFTENQRNKPPQKNNRSGLKGVHISKEGKFEARINVDKKEIYLGYFYTPEEAARAYDKAALEIHKEFAYLNRV
jgi:hypothetical protein